MWYDNVASPYGIYYAESSDGVSWTQDSGNPIIASIGAGVKVFKHASTYYLYAGPGDFSGTSISAYTSPDGVTWTLQNASALVPSQTWENTSIYQLAICDVVGGTWYGYYCGAPKTGSGFLEGLATSTDGIHWTKSLSNPVASMSNGVLNFGAPWTGSGNFTFQKIGASYYGWSQITLSEFPGALINASFSLPSSLTRWSAPTAAGPWTQLGSLTYYCNDPATEGTNTALGQVADPTILEVSGETHLFYSAVPDGTAETTASYINHAIAGMTLASLVKTYEGVQDVPIPFPGGAASFNFSTLGSDNFVRASLGPNWTQEFTIGAPAQIASNLAEPSVVAKFADSFYNPLSFPNDQWSQVKLQTLSGGSAQNYAQAGAIVRAAVNQAGTEYRGIVFGNLGVAFNSGEFTGIYMQKSVTGSFTNVASITNSAITPHQGDQIACVAVGGNVFVYYNGYLVLVVADSSITAGSSGFCLQSVTGGVVTDAQLNGWVGGGFQNAPNPRPVHGKRSTRSK